jgi:peptide/nickel transport system permease protein
MSDLETGTDRRPQESFVELSDAVTVRRFRFSIKAKIGISVVAFWILMTVLGPFLAPFDPAEMISLDNYNPITSTYWLGTDYVGRDILSRILYGARVTIGLSFVATTLAFLVGTTLGFTAAVSGPVVDTIISRIYDGLMSMPTMMLGLVAIAALGSSFPVLIVTAGLIYSCGLFRIARALAMDIKVMDFVEAARARGERLPWIIRREILPNAAIPLISEFGLRLVFSILFISGLSFLGLGVQPPTADWGVMVRENIGGLLYGSPAAIVPALTIATLTISINLIVDDISAYHSRDVTEAMV